MELSASMSKKIQSQGLNSSLRKEEEEIMPLQKQGIVTIFDSEEMKNIASSEELSHSKVTTTNADSKTAQFDLWSSIIQPQKAIDETTSAIITPYIHPLVKKSKNSMSQKSLKICTESLGSETGSDGFSSEEDKEEKEKEQEQLLQPHEVVELQVLEFNNSSTTTSERVSLTVMPVKIFNQRPKKHKSSHHSFPPPLQSLQMLSHRYNGRLFLQAVVVPSHKNFCAKCQDGRLVLTFACEQESQAQEMEEDDEENEVENVEETNNGVMEQPTMLCSEITSVNKLLALVMNKAKWSEKLNESLTHRPRLAG